MLHQALVTDGKLGPAQDAQYNLPYILIEHEFFVFIVAKERWQAEEDFIFLSGTKERTHFTYFNKKFWLLLILANKI